MTSFRLLFVALVALVALWSSSFLGVCNGQTQINACWLSYSPINEGDQDTGSAYGVYWSSQLIATLTLNTNTAVGSLASTNYTVTAATGTRTVASLAGNNVVGSTTAISLTPATTCTSGCDQQFYPAANSPDSGYFSALGTSFTLASPQVDISGCDTQTFRIMSNAAYGDPVYGNVTSNCDSDVQVFGLVATYPVGSSVPSICQYSTIAPIVKYTCGIGPYNFLPMATFPDLVGNFNGNSLFIRMCGSVSQGTCADEYGADVMACQVGTTSELGNIIVYPQALTYTTSPAGAMTFSYANGVDGSAGINFTSADGQPCSSPRVFTGTLVCGSQAAITSYSENPTCTYNYIITTPLACPPVQNLAFCQISSTTPVAAYNTWMTSISGIINGSMAPPSQQANNGQAGVTYIAQSFLASPAATISVSQLYLATPTSTTSASSVIPPSLTSVTGAVGQTFPVTIASVGSYEGNDNVVYYLSGSSAGWVTNFGLSFAYNSTQNSQVYFGTGTTQVNVYYDQFIGPFTSYYSQLQMTPLGTSTTLPAGWCAAPTLVAGQAAGTSQTFGYCLITYATGIYGQYTSSYFYASVTSGTITASTTANQGQYQVSAITGSRYTSTTLGVAVASGSTTTVSLGGSASTAQYIYYNSQLVNSTTDGINGLTFQLASAQSDPSGCSGSTVQILGQAVTCGTTSPNGGSEYPSYLTSFTLSPGSTVPSCTPLVQAVQPYSCGIGQYNFGSLSTGPDLTFTQNGYTLYFRPCAAVSQPACVATYGNNTMACQLTPPTSAYELATFQSPYGSAEFSYVNGVDNAAGILMTMADGLMCNDASLYPRRLYVTFLCGAASSGTQLVYYAEQSSNGGTQCWYNLTVLTPLACSNAAAPVIANTTCAIGNYNFTQLAYNTGDLVGSFGGYGIYMRLCGAVQNKWCQTWSSPTQVCQYYANVYGTTGMAYTGYGSTGINTQLSYTNGVDGTSGINYYIANGDAACGLAARIVYGTITCGAVSEMTSFIESPSCNYQINITTPLACAGGVGNSITPPGTANTVQFAFCLTVSSTNLVPGITTVISLMTGTLTATQQTPGSAVYVVTGVTGTRSVYTINGSVLSTASLTGVASGLGASQVIYYVPLASLVYVDALGIAVQLSTAQSDSLGCSGSTITLFYGQIGCGNGYLSLSGYSLTIVPLIGSATAPFCAVPSYTIQTPGFCGVGQYNLASLASGPDLSFTGGGYTIYARLCGVVSQPDCVASYGNNIQICQWGSSSSQYEIASLYATGNETTFAYANGKDISQGLTYKIADGGLCGSIPRAVTGTITCGATNNITNYYQVPVVTCQYVINFTSPLVCAGVSSSGPVVVGVTSSSSSSGGAAAASGSAASSSSSGLSGGAIAGIVIGSVVGVVLLCILLFFAFSFARRSDSKKRDTTQTSGQTGNYGQVESSRAGESSLEQSKVEMEPMHGETR